MKLETLKQAQVDVQKALEFWGDENSYFDSLQEYHNSLITRLSALKEYWDSQDYQNYGILSHTLKSEAKYLGFMQEAETFLNHEQAGKTQNDEYIKNNFSNLKATIEHIKDIIEKAETSLNPTVIIADDSSIILNFLESNLKNYNTIKAHNGQEVINNLSNDIYALFLDLNMPQIDGFKVLEYMQNNNLFYDIPVIVITGDDSKETIKKAFNYDILDILNKPFKNNSIARILNSIQNFHNNNLN